MRNDPDHKVAFAIHESEVSDFDYSKLLTSINQSFSAVGSQQLFRTDANDNESLGKLWHLYLSNIPEHQRQHHNCHACRHFIERYGPLVWLDAQGYSHSALFSLDPQGLYSKSFAALRERLARSKIIEPFYSADKLWGTPTTGIWHHPAVVNRNIFSDSLKTPSQASAAKRHNFTTVMRALTEFKPEALDQVIRILEADAVSRAGHFLAPMKWLRSLHDINGPRRTAQLWREITAAPEGFCHPRSGPCASLLEGVLAGEDVETMASKFNAMLHPLRYQRPQAAPSSGNIKQAEEIVAKLGLEPSLRRRFARLEDCISVWSPVPAPAISETPGSIFSHLRQPSVKPVELNRGTTPATWEKFYRDYLPSTTELKIRAPGHGNYCGILTAVNPDAKCLLRWGNHCSWYVYVTGSAAYDWNLNLTQSTWHEVTGIVPEPSTWRELPDSFGPNEIFELGQNKSVVLTIKDCVDIREPHLCLFPETLIPELHSVRSTIEAFSQSRKVEGKEDASACGLAISTKARNLNLQLRAKINSEWRDFLIDRFE